MCEATYKFALGPRVIYGQKSTFYQINLNVRSNFRNCVKSVQVSTSWDAHVFSVIKEGNCDDFGKKMESVRPFCQKLGFCPYAEREWPGSRASPGGREG